MLNSGGDMMPEIEPMGARDWRKPEVDSAMRIRRPEMAGGRGAGIPRIQENELLTSTFQDLQGALEAAADEPETDNLLEYVREVRRARDERVRMLGIESEFPGLKRDMAALQREATTDYLGVMLRVGAREGMAGRVAQINAVLSDSQEVREERVAVVDQYYADVQHAMAVALSRANGEVDVRAGRLLGYSCLGNPNKLRTRTLPLEVMAMRYVNSLRSAAGTGTRETVDLGSSDEHPETLMPRFMQEHEGPATGALATFLNEMAEAEEVNVFTSDQRLEAIKKVGKFGTEFKLAVDAFVGLLRLNRQMSLGGGRFDVIAKALYFENPSKFGGYVAQVGIARLMREDAGMKEAMEVTGKMFGINVPGRESVRPVMALKNGVGLTGDEIEDRLKDIQRSAKCDRLQAVAAFTALRALGYGQGLDHYSFVAQFVIGARVSGKEKLGEDLDWADVKPYLEKSDLDEVWEQKGTNAFMVALSHDKGPLYKYWDDKTKLRGGLLQVMGDRQASAGHSFDERYKDLIAKVTEMAGKDQLFADNSSKSMTVKRLGDTARMQKDAPSLSRKPDFVANEQAVINEDLQDLRRLWNRLTGRG